MPMYRLTRTDPGGAQHELEAVTLRAVETAAAYVLLNNARVPRGEARTFAASLIRSELGTVVQHAASGYIFRIDRTAG